MTESPRATPSIVDASVVLILAVVLAALYSQVFNHQFVYDSLGFVWENPYIREFSVDNLQWLLLNSYREAWQPVTWLSHTLDFVLFGDWPGGHHLVNVTWHFVVCLLLYLVLLKVLTRAGLDHLQVKIAAGLAALLFALHPLHVESVTMVYERRDMLYSVFLLLSALLYLRSPNDRLSAPYITSLLCYVLALMSKPMAVTFPVLLVLLDLWLDADRRVVPRWGFWRASLPGKIPYLLLALPVIPVTIITQGEAVAPLEFFPLGYRLLNVSHNLWFFATQFMWPVNLSAYYPMIPLVELSSPARWLPGLTLVLMVSGAGWWCWLRGQRGLLVLWLMFLVSLSPASGIVHAGGTATADHFVYLSLAGGCVAVGWVAARFWRPVTLVLVGVWLLALSGISYVQIDYWRSPLSLWTHTLAIYPEAMVPRKNLALTYILIGEYEEAEQHIRRLPDPIGEEVRRILELQRSADPAVRSSP